MFKFGRKSKQRLETTHKDFQRVANLALSICSVDFGFSECKRTLATQKIYVDTGRSTTLKSRHLVDSTGRCFAGDVYAYVDGKASYKPRHMKPIAKAMFKAAIALGVEIEWGGHWGSFTDMPHYQLSWAAYPPVKKSKKRKVKR